MMTEDQARTQAQEMMEGSTLTRPVEMWLNGHYFVLEPTGNGADWQFITRLTETHKEVSRVALDGGRKRRSKTDGIPRKKVMEMRKQKISVADIAKRFKVSTASVYNILKTSK